jgi:DUF1365 family protein
MESCIYRGTVEHFRRGDVAHRFKYSLFMAYLDLDELPVLLKRCVLLSSSRFAPASFRRSDHTGDVTETLGETIRVLVDEETGSRPQGPIRVLTQLRFWGYYFSPLNLYYCFDEDGKQVEAIVAEVNNTPWGEQHCYVLWSGNRTPSDRDGGEIQRYQHKKSFHVSPFMGMDAEYHWRITPPADGLDVRIQSRRAGKPIFDATMNLNRSPITDRSLAAHLIRFPFMTVKLICAIYFEALRLWLKQAPFCPHPRTLRPTPQPSATRPPAVK